MKVFELLAKARLEKRAILAVNVSNMETIAATLEVANKVKYPIIVQVSPIQIEAQKLSYKLFVDLVHCLAAHYPCDYIIHLDHATTFEECKNAVDAGFDSVMYDGSKLTYEENVISTSKVVDYAHSKNVAVEAELGRVGGEEGTYSTNQNAYLTSLDEVIDFCSKVNIDSLAVAIGNAHGFYVNEPKLNFVRLKEISEHTDLPLVLHGGSGISDADFKKAISYGISKINVFTELDSAFVKGFVSKFNEDRKVYMMFAQRCGRDEMSRVMFEKMQVCR